MNISEFVERGEAVKELLGVYKLLNQLHFHLSFQVRVNNCKDTHAFQKLTHACVEHTHLVYYSHSFVKSPVTVSGTAMVENVSFIIYIYSWFCTCYSLAVLGFEHNCICSQILAAMPKYLGGGGGGGHVHV